MGDLTENFSRSEFECGCGCGYNQIKKCIVFALQITRYKFNARITITSGCRCGAHNKEVGGVNNSKHMFGIAADFVVEGVDPREVAKFLNEYFGFTNGIGCYEGFTHFDTGAVRWRGGFIDSGRLEPSHPHHYKR